MWFKTRAVILTAGMGTGSSRIVAFDAALRSAAIADFNLIRVTSIVPPKVPVYIMKKGVPAISGDGCMLPVVYATTASNDPKKILSAAVGVGVPTDRTRSGVIFVNQGIDLSEVDCVAGLEEMIGEGMTMLRRTDSYAFQHAAASQQTDDSGKWYSLVAALCFADDHLWPYFENLVERVS